MPVTIKTGMTIQTLVLGFWSDEEAQGGIFASATDLHAYGYTIVVHPSAISIVAPDKDGVPSNMVSQIQLKAGSLKLALQNKIGLKPKNVIKAQIAELINFAKLYSEKHPTLTKEKVLEKATAGYMGELKDQILGIYHGTIPSHSHTVGFIDPDSKFKVAAIKKLRELTHIGLKEAKDQVEAWVDEDSFTVTGTGVADGNYEPIPGLENPTYKSTKSHIMNLADAEHLHQAVKGTSNNSRYYVVALGDDARVAVRIKSATDISIRAICTKAPASKEGQAVKAAFERASLQKAQGGHWSLHLHPTDMTMAERSIGATLFAMSIPFWAVTGDLKALVGK